MKIRFFFFKCTLNSIKICALIVISGAQECEARQRSTMGTILGETSILPRNFGYARPSAHTDCRGGGGEAGQPLGTGVFGPFSLAGNRVAALHLATRVFLAGNHISGEQRNKEQKRTREKKGRNLKNLSEESLGRSRGRRRGENFNEEHRTTEINTARDKTLIYNGCLSGKCFRS